MRNDIDVTTTPDRIELSENALVLLVTSQTSSVFVNIAKEHPKARAISLSAPELLFWGTKGSITDYGEFRKLKNKIIQEHNGDILAVFTSQYVLFRETKAIIDGEKCFNASKTVEINGKTLNLPIKDLHFCKISKKSDLLLNEE